MFSNKIKFLNSFDSSKKQVFLISIHSNEITIFNQYYRFILGRVKELNNEELTDSFDSVKLFFNHIRGTFLDFEEALSEIDMRDLGIFFDELNGMDYDEQTSEVLQRFGQLIGRFRRGKISNKLGDVLRKLYSEHGGTNVVVSYSRNDNIQRKFNQVSIDKYLREYEYYDCAFIIGSPSYYSGKNNVFKANKTYFLSYDIYSNNLKESTIIQENVRENSGVFSGVSITKVGIAPEETRDEYQELILNRTSLSYRNWLKEYNNRKQNQEYSISAKAVELATGSWIFFPVKSKVRVFSKIEGTVSSINLSELEYRDWIVLKHSSSNEYIREKAREKIGPEYDEMFTKVTQYKEQLINYKLENHLSIEELVIVLGENGIKVQLQVLKQWVYGSTIAPFKYSEVLEFLEYEEDLIKQLEGYYNRIRSAHQIAGRILSENIKKFIEAIDSNVVHKQMTEKQTYDFELENIGKFSIEEITIVNDEILEVENSDLYKVLGN